MKAKITKMDLKNIHEMLYVKGLAKSDVARQYGYSDTSAFKKGLNSLGYCIQNALRSK